MGDRERCPTCNRPIPAEKETHEGPTGPPRKRMNIAIPPGEEGVLEDLLIQFVERFKPRWAGQEDDMPEIGQRHWKYIALHHGLYSLVTAPDEVADLLLPAEIGG